MALQLDAVRDSLFGVSIRALSITVVVALAEALNAVY